VQKRQCRVASPPSKALEGLSNKQHQLDGQPAWSNRRSSSVVFRKPAERSTNAENMFSRTRALPSTPSTASRGVGILFLSRYGAVQFATGPDGAAGAATNCPQAALSDCRRISHAASCLAGLRWPVAHLCLGRGPTIGVPTPETHDGGAATARSDR